MSQATGQRKSYLDILRILAAFLVCYNHSHGFHLYLSQEASGSVLSWINVFLPVLTTVNIPLFFMISGALLLDKEESYRVLFTRRILRFCLLIFFASLITCGILQGDTFSLSRFLPALLEGNVTISYWYLYAYLGFLAALPFLRKIAASLTGRDLCFLLVLRFVFVSVLMSLNLLLESLGRPALAISGYLQFPFATFDILFYPLVGHCLSHLEPSQYGTRKHLAFYTAVLAAGCCLSAGMTYLEGLHSGFSQTYIGLFNYSSAMCVFLLVRFPAEKRTLPAPLRSFLRTAGSVTIGIYLMEPVISHFFLEPFFRRASWDSVSITGLSILWCLFCMAAGGTATWLLRKIPYVQKVL